MQYHSVSVPYIPLYLQRLVHVKNMYLINHICFTHISTGFMRQGKLGLPSFQDLWLTKDLPFIIHGAILLLLIDPLIHRQGCAYMKKTKKQKIQLGGNGHANVLIILLFLGLKIYLKIIYLLRVSITIIIPFTHHKNSISNDPRGRMLAVEIKILA